MVTNGTNPLLYEDAYTFELGGVRFTITCKCDEYNVMYIPMAELGEQKVYGDPITWSRPYFEALRFATPPDWLVQATAGYSTIYERPRGRGKQERDPELVVVLLCVEEVRKALQAWAASHPLLN